MGFHGPTHPQMVRPAAQEIRPACTRGEEVPEHKGGGQKDQADTERHPDLPEELPGVMVPVNS